MPHRDQRVTEIAQAISERAKAPAAQVVEPVTAPEEKQSRLEPGAHLDGGGNVIIIKEDGAAIPMEEQRKEPLMEMLNQMRDDHKQALNELTQVVTELKAALSAPKEVIRGSDGLITGIKMKSGE